MTKKIYRSESDRMIAGVCGGIGEYFDIDPTIVRIIFAIVLLSGGGLILYIILWIVIPTESRVNRGKDNTKQNKDNKNSEPVDAVQFDTKKGEKK